jgi:hypothetical protein
MKKLSVFGIVAGAVLLTATPVSLQGTREHLALSEPLPRSLTRFSGLTTCENAWARSYDVLPHDQVNYQDGRKILLILQA